MYIQQLFFKYIRSLFYLDNCQLSRPGVTFIAGGVLIAFLQPTQPTAHMRSGRAEINDKRQLSDKITAVCKDSEECLLAVGFCRFRTTLLF